MVSMQKRIFLVLTLVLLVACGRGGSDSRLLDEPRSGPKLDLQTASSLQALLDDHIAFSAEAGISLSVRIGEDVHWHGVSGLADRQQEKPLRAGARYRAGSNTKMFVAAVIMQLVEEGKLTLDATVGGFFPDYEKWREITVRQLLSMQAGIPEYLQSKLLLAAALWSPGRSFTPQGLLSYVEHSSLLFQSGADCAYSNSNTLLLGLIIEKVTGRPLADELDRRVISRLNLENTYLDDGSERDDRLAHGYMDALLTAATMEIPLLTFSFLRREYFVGDNLIDATYLFHPSATWAAGGLVSNTDDLTRFVQGLLGGDLVSEESLQQMLTFRPCTVLKRKVDYGLGLMRHPSPWGDAYGHGGLNFGYKTETFYIPQADLAWSEMNGWFPEQTEIINEEILATLGGSAAPTTSCRVPNDLFAVVPDGTDYLDLRFRGRIGSSEEQVRGTANFTAQLAGRRKPYYGAISHAQIKSADGQSQLETLSLAPTTSKTKLNLAMVRIDDAAFSTIGADGILPVGGTQGTGPLVMLADLYMAASGDGLGAIPSRMCVTAVHDVTQTGRISICDPANLRLQPGDLFRMLGRVPLQTDGEAVEAFVKDLDMDRCMCFGADGNLIRCEDPS